VNELRELYQEVILDHNKSPRNKGEMPEATSHADGFNPLCGDQIQVFVEIEGDVVKDVRFTGHGCAISTASASLMTEAIKGKSVDEVREIFEKFHTMVTDSNADDEAFLEEYDSLAALSGVREFPVRVKCATLAWHTLNEALKGGTHVATTE
jgi:nitrogen fixation protein NifU and related proteins